MLVDPARKIRIGNKLYFGDDDLLVAEVIDNTTSRGRTLRFLFDGSYEEFKEALFALGETPLPKWVREKVEPEDAERYQTIFAAKEGAVAAPTAGMHFSKHLMKRMEIKGVDRTFITLHVGLGNFRTVDVEDLSKHKMDSEQFIVTDETAATVNEAKRDGRKIVAIGTTVMRTLETAVSTAGMIKAHGGLDQQVHLRALRVLGGRRDGDEPPPALLDAADDGGGVRRLRNRHERLQNRQGRGLPLRDLRRRDADSLTPAPRRPGNVREFQIFTYLCSNINPARSGRRPTERPRRIPDRGNRPVRLKPRIMASKILYVCQQIAPYLPETEASKLCRSLVQAMQERGNEIRTFMPRYGCINERRHQLHEVIRLSGMNLIIDDNDHQLIIKVASIPAARVQIYFIDNDDYFSRKAILHDAEGREFADNDERAIFFARGVLETVKKLRWAPTVVHCHGWFAGVVPVYLKRSSPTTRFSAT